MGPEATLADGLVRNLRLMGGLPGVARRLAAMVPLESAAPPLPPLPALPERRPSAWPGVLLGALAGAALALGAVAVFG